MLGRTRKKLEKFLRESAKNPQLKTIQKIILFIHWQLMGPMNYNNAYYWVHLTCKELIML